MRTRRKRSAVAPALWVPLAVAAVPAIVALGAAGGSGRAEVRYIPAGEVQVAFDKGAVLFDGGNYMVHASRRDAAGQAEVHLQDTDVIHVLEGSATFVTGGTVVDGKTTAPDEIRGPSIRDGETRRLVRGDVIIVPDGTPHWFREVEPPLVYYVVKVRKAGGGPS